MPKQPAKKRSPQQKPEGHFSQAYLDFIKSPEWRAKREEVLKRDGYECRMCAGKRKDGIMLQVDHRVYCDRNLPYEQAIEAFRNQSIDTMITLCVACHKIRTRKVRANKKKSAKPKRKAKLNRTQNPSP